jgi:hypothetical protein
MPSRWLPVAALAVALAMHVEALARIGRVLDRTPRPDKHRAPWWFGYQRDGTNLAATLAYWVAYAKFGFAPPVAFLAACLTSLATYALDWLFGRRMHLKRVRLAVALPLGAWLTLVAMHPAAIDALLGSLIAQVEPTR